MSALLDTPQRSALASRLADGLVLEVTDAPAALSRVAAEWQELLSRCPGRNLFLTNAWTRAWWAAFGGEGELRLLTLRDGGRLVALAVYRLWRVRVRGVPVRVLGTFSNTHVSRNDLLVLPGYEQEAAGRIARWFAQCAAEWDVARLQQLPADNRWSASFLAAARDAGLLPSGVIPGVAKCSMPVNQRWAEYVEQRGNHFRRGIGKTSRRIERRGAVVYQHSLNPHPADADFAAFANVETRSWKDDPDANARLGPPGWAFQQAFATAYDEGFSCDNWIVSIDGTPMAIVHTVGYERVNYCFQTLYDERARDIYLGRAAVTRHVEHVFDSGLYDVLDFNGDSPFCRSWGPAEVPYISLRLHNRRPLSRVLWGVSQYRQRAREARDREAPSPGPSAGPPQAGPHPPGGSIAVPGDRGAPSPGPSAGPPQAGPHPLGGSIAVPGDRGAP